MRRHLKNVTVHILRRFVVISNYFEHKQRYLPLVAGRDSVASIATVYGLDCPGIESRGMRDFLYPSSPALRSPQPPVQCVPDIFLGWGEKWLGIGVDHPPPSTTQVKKRVEVYFYFPFGPSWPVIGWILQLSSTLVFDLQFREFPTLRLQEENEVNWSFSILQRAY